MSHDSKSNDRPHDSSSGDTSPAELDQVYILFGEGEKCFRQGDMEEAIEHFKKAVTFSEIPREKALLYKAVAYCYRELESYRQAADNFAIAFELYSADVHSENAYKVECAFAAGALYQEEELHNRAIEFFQKALNLNENPNQKAVSLDRIGQNYFVLKDFKKSVEYSTMAADLSTDLQNKAIYFQNVGFYYRKKDNFDKALEFGKKALPLCKENSNDKATCLSLIGAVYWDLNDDQNASTYFVAAAELDTRHHKKSDRYRKSASAFLRQYNYAKAKECFAKSADFAKDEKDKAEARDNAAASELCMQGQAFEEQEDSHDDASDRFLEAYEKYNESFGKKEAYAKGWLNRGLFLSQSIVRSTPLERAVNNCSQPNDRARAHAEIVKIYLQICKLPKAMEHAALGLTLATKPLVKADLHHSLAKMYTDQKNTDQAARSYDEAYRNYRDAIALNPKDLKALKGMNAQINEQVALLKKQGKNDKDALCEVVHELVERCGVPPTMPIDKKGNTLEHLASMKGYGELSAFLAARKRAGQPEVKNNDGRTPAGVECRPRSESSTPKLRPGDVFHQSPRPIAEHLQTLSGKQAFEGHQVFAPGQMLNIVSGYLGDNIGIEPKKPAGGDSKDKPVPLPKSEVKVPNPAPEMTGVNANANAFASAAAASWSSGEVKSKKPQPGASSVARVAEDDDPWRPFNG